MTKFAIAAMHATEVQRNGITDYLRQLGGYWHWMPDFWLLNSPVDRQPSEIRDAILEAYPNVKLLVLRVVIPDGEHWAGTFPTGLAEQWSEWLNQEWQSRPRWP
jgi:hypothetical protein